MRRLRLPVAVLTLCLLPAIAFGAAAAPAPSVSGTGTVPDAPLAKTAPTLEVQLWPDQTSSAILVYATIPTSTPLPVRVRLPLPAGATIDWLGEILGGLPEQDITGPYRLIENGTVVETVLTKSRIAQYEATYVPPTLEGGLIVSRLEWVQSTPAASVRFAVRAASQIKDVTISPASQYAPQFNDKGERLYVLKPRTLKVGEKMTLAATYRAGTETAQSAGSGSSPLSTVLVVAASLLGVAVIALVVILRRRPRSDGGD